MNAVPSPTDWRKRHFKLIWSLLWPIRLYIKSFPIHPGKGVLLRICVVPLLPPSPAEYELSLPGDGKVALQYRETLGLSSLLYGVFERAELTFVARYLRPGDNALDIGANVGIFSVAMGRILRAGGRVLAFEPVPSNLDRLIANLARNALESTVRVMPCALGNTEGEMAMHLASDPAFPSLVKVELGLADGRILPVPVCRLDRIWEEAGKPDVSFVKLDVEGAEADVIRGGAAFLAACRPTILVEANSPEQLSVLRGLLSPYGYQTVRPEGFTVHNYLFVHPTAVANGRAVS